MGRRVVGAPADPIVALRVIFCAARRFVVLAAQHVNILADPILYAAVVAMNSSDVIDPRSTATKPARHASEPAQSLAFR